jgi:hypothetical protein
MIFSESRLRLFGIVLEDVADNVLRVDRSARIGGRGRREQRFRD